MFGTSKRRPDRRLQLQELEPRQMLAGPSGLEQEFLQRVNRFRIDPQGEYGRMIEQTSPLVAHDPAVQNNLDFFQVNGSVLRSQWNQLSPVPPLAWNADLQEAAEGHTALMVTTNTQSHQIGNEPSLGDRLHNAGYSFSAAAENVFAYCESIDFCHAGLAIDWGDGPHGIQSPPGHRDNLLSDTYTEVGIAVQRTSTSGPGTVGPLVATQDFGARRGLSPRIVGAVFEDRNGSGWYDAGEGKGGVTVRFVGTAGTSDSATTATMTAGGYQLELEPGVYEASFTIGGQEYVQGGVAVEDENVWLNFDTTLAVAAPQAAGDFASVREQESTLLDVLANDVANVGQLDRDTLRIETASTAGGSWENDGGQIRFTPHSGVSGLHENRYRVADGSGAVSGWAEIRVMVLQSEGPLWQNPVDPADVDADGRVLPIDALYIINELNRRGIGQQLPSDPGVDGPTRYVDVDGDGSVLPVDALRVINALNADATRQTTSSTEGEASDTEMRTSSQTALLVSAVDQQELETLRQRQMRALSASPSLNA